MIINQTTDYMRKQQAAKVHYGRCASTYSSSSSVCTLFHASCIADCKQVERQQLGVAARHHRHKAQLKAWRAWQGRTKQHQSTRAAASRWKRSYLVSSAVRSVQAVYLHAIALVH